MGLRNKIFSGFLILTIMLAVAGAWSIHELNSIGASVQNLLDDNYKSINATKMMIEALEREDSAVLLLLLGRSEEAQSILDSADDLFKQGFSIAEGNITIPGEKSSVNDIREKYASYKKLWKRPIIGTQFERNLDWYSQNAHKAFSDAKISVEKLMSLNDRVMYQTASNLKQRAHRAIMPGIIAILSALVFTLIFNYCINYYVVGPILRLTNGIHKYLKKGEAFEARIETNDELRDLANSVQNLMAIKRRQDEML